MFHSRKQAGFTLIELMIVVAIVGILAAVAVPSFLEQMRKGWRAEGKAAAMAAVQQEERFFTMNNTYTTTLTDAGIRSVSCDDATTSRCRYTLSIAAGASGIATGFVVTVTPQSWTDARCGNLTLSNTGVRGVTGTLSVAECWQ